MGFYAGTGWENSAWILDMAEGHKFKESPPYSRTTAPGVKFFSTRIEIRFSPWIPADLWALIFRFMPMAARTFLMRFRLDSPRRIMGATKGNGGSTGGSGSGGSGVRGVDRHRLWEICQKVSAVKQLLLVEWNRTGWWVRARMGAYGRQLRFPIGWWKYT